MKTKSFLFLNVYTMNVYNNVQIIYLHFVWGLVNYTEKKYFYDINSLFITK